MKKIRFFTMLLVVNLIIAFGVGWTIPSKVSVIVNAVLVLLMTLLKVTKR